MLTIYYGVGFYSITLIVSIYMLGLGVGGYVGGILAERRKNKILTYLVIEVLIGLFGLASPKLLNLLGFYTAGVNYSISSLLIFFFLSIPTFLMGTTLPLLIKIYNQLKQNFLHSVSVLYFVNTLGAAFGALIGTYVLISFFGLEHAIHFAAALNLLIGLAIYLLLGKHYRQDAQREPTAQPLVSHTQTQDNLNIRQLYMIVFVTGFVAIGYELIWFRVINVITKDSSYSFSTFLFIYLLGLAIGSYLMNVIAQRMADSTKRKLYFALQALLGVFVLFSFYLLYKLNTFPNFLSSWTDSSFVRMVHPDFTVPHSFGELISKYDVFFWPLALIFVPTLIMGASFPLITYLGIRDNTKEGKTVGTIYFFNVAGNVLGGILTGLVLLPLLKTSGTVLTYSAINLFFAIGLFRTKKHRVAAAVSVAGIMTLALVVFPDNFNFYKAVHSAYPEKFGPAAYTTAIEEGKESVVVTYYDEQHVYKNFINGSNHGSRPGYSYFYEAAEVFRYHPAPTSVFVLGFGAGSITEACVRNPLTKQVTMVEINATLMTNLKKIAEVRNIIDHPKVQNHIEDGRRFLLSDPTCYDAIFIDPLRMQTAYSNNIHSKDFFSLLKSRLKPGGILMVGGQEHPIKEATLMSVFKYVRCYAYFMLGSDTPFEEKSASQQAFWNALSATEKEKILAESSFIADEKLLRDELRFYPVNSDWQPYTEYFLATEHRIQKSHAANNSPVITSVAKASHASRNYPTTFSYRVAFEQVEEIPQDEKKSGSSLPDQLIIPPGNYSVFGKKFIFNKQGLYRFSSRTEKTDIQRIVYAGSLDTLLSSLAWICTHSQLDDDLTNLQKSEVAKYRKLSTLCGPASAWASEILEKCGYKTRMVMGLTLEEWGADNGHTLVEAYDPGTQKWQVFDITNNCYFTDNNKPLSFLELYKALKESRNLEVRRLATDSQYDHTGFGNSGYNYSLGAERISTLSSLKKWYARDFQAALIQSPKGFVLFNDKADTVTKRILTYDKSFAAPDTSVFMKTFYGQ